MKLTLSHSDVISGICAFLADRGLTGFDPSKVHADFTKGRDGKLSVVLDDEAPVDAEPKQPKAKAAPVQTTDVAASGVKETPAVADVANAAAAEVPAGEAAAETAVAVETATTAEPAAAAGEENLFG